MSNTHHSLSLKAIGYILVQNGLFAALLFYVARDATPLETAVIIGALVLSAIATIALASRTLGALKSLSGELSAIAEGNGSIAPEYLRRRDEIGTIAREFERLSSENLTRLVDDDEERDRRHREEAEREERQARELEAANNRTKTLKDVVEATDHAIRRLAAGDLGSRLDTPFPNEFEGLRADFNHATITVQETLERIEDSARRLRSTCADVKEDSSSAMQKGLSQTTAMARAAEDICSLAETLRLRRMQSEHTANIAYNARIDLRRPKDATHAAAKAMSSAQEASRKVEPIAEVIRELAFEANMLAMNIGISAAHEDAQQANSPTGTLATDIRSLAERAAEAARELSVFSRQCSDAVEHGSQSVAKAEAEIDAMVIYSDALKGHLDTIVASSSTEIDKIASIRLSILALAKNGRDQGITLEALATRTDRMMREVGAIDHHAGRFTPVTVLTQGGVTIPESMKPPKRGSHLRLVKS